MHFRLLLEEVIYVYFVTPRGDLLLRMKINFFQKVERPFFSLKFRKIHRCTFKNGHITQPALLNGPNFKSRLILLWFLGLRSCMRCWISTWAEADVRDGVSAMVEAQQVLQRVCVHHQDATIAQSHRQRFPIRREGTAATAWKRAGCYKEPNTNRSSIRTKGREESLDQRRAFLALMT